MTLRELRLAFIAVENPADAAGLRELLPDAKLVRGVQAVHGALGIQVEGEHWLPRVGELTPERLRSSVEKQAPQPLEKGDPAVPP